jgi:hypothetical protein
MSHELHPGADIHLRRFWLPVARLSRNEETTAKLLSFWVCLQTQRRYSRG